MNKRHQTRYCWLFVYLIVFIDIGHVAVADEIKIGVRAISGADLAIKKWQPTVDYLSRVIPEHSFTLIPYEINGQLNQAASRKEFHFVLTNPAAHIEQKIRYGATPIATLINKRKNKGYTKFGSVIFTRANRTDINSYNDLIGKTFMGADEQGFGGWRVAWYELLENEINPYQDFSRLSFGGGIQFNVVMAVRSGKVDAGAVRTDLLERLAQKGKIQISEFKVIGAKSTEGFEFMHSTKLYPEWPFAKLEHTPQSLASKVAAALYKIKPDSEAAIKGRYVGWNFPLDYTPVENLLKELRVGPYKTVSPLTWYEVFSIYWNYIFLFFLLFLVISIALTFVIRSNRRLKQIRHTLEEEITERNRTDEKLQNAQRMLQQVMDTIPVRLFWKDTDSVFLGCNKLFARDAGLDNVDQITGKTDYDMGWAEQAHLYQADDKDVMQRSQPKINFEEQQTTPEGHKIWLETSKFPLQDTQGKVIGLLGAYTDITERKRNIKELEEYKHDLEKKVKERTAALEISNRELESYSYSIAHDLRAPLRSLIGFSQILSEDAAAKLNEQELDSLNRIVTAGKHMAELIDDILELSRISRSKLHIAPVNISDITHDVIETLTNGSGENKINWDIQDDMLDQCDEVLLRLLIQNLVDNACKFTRNSKSPKIEVGFRGNGSGNIYHVRDNGIGFDMQYAEKIFMPFRRLHSDEFDGTGIGLASVQRIVELHGGKIWADSKPHQGATFHFTLNSDRVITTPDSKHL